MSSKPKIVVFIDWYVPAYKAGGPIRSVYNLIETLYNVYDFYVITSNLDIDGVKLRGIEINKWTIEGKAKVLYLSPEEQSKKRLKKEVNEIAPSKVYLNSLFSSNFTLLPLYLFKNNYEVIVAPRGMLGKESLAIKSTKKKVFLNISKILGLYKKVTWHVSSRIEAEEVKKVFGESSKINIASNLTLVPENFSLLHKEKGALSVLMVGRVVPIKNIYFFLQELKGISPESKVKVSIVGPIEDEDYHKECLTMVNKLSNNIKVNFLGALPPLEITKLYNRHHVLVSTSLNENYGHSIAEALTYGRPILVSNNTPWKNLKELGIGANLELENGIFTKELQRVTDLEDLKFQEYQNKARNYAFEKFKSNKTIEASVELFNNGNDKR